MGEACKAETQLVSELYRFFAATAFIAIVIGYFYLDEILPEVRNWLRPAGDTIIGRASVIDGDTIEIQGQRIRLNGVDAPESAQFCINQDGKRYGCGSEAAIVLKLFLELSVPTRCEFVEWDQYGRYVGDCYRADDVSLAVGIVRSGYALDWPRYSKGKYSTYEAEAKAEKVGMWAGNFEVPWEYRARLRAQETSQKMPLVRKHRTQACNIKGNISKKGERIYHVPGQKYYDKTVISTWKGERWFCSEAKARGAGWRRARV